MASIVHTDSKQTWRRHQRETFSALLAICAGNSPGPVTRSFDVFFDLRPNKRQSKQSRGWWLETPWRPLWRHSNVFVWPIACMAADDLNNKGIHHAKWRVLVFHNFNDWNYFSVEIMAANEKKCIFFSYLEYTRQWPKVTIKLKQHPYGKCCAFDLQRHNSIVQQFN